MGLNSKNMKTIEQKIQELKNINFFIGGLTDEAIEYYYNKLIKIYENEQAI